MTEEDALWQAIGAAPEDQLPRLVAADWYDERAGMVGCGCKGGQVYEMGVCRDGIYRNRWVDHKRCDGTGRVSNGNAETAAALRATADRVPRCIDASGDYTPGHYWNCIRNCGEENKASKISKEEFAALSDGSPDDVYPHYWRYYGTAADAIRDLCRAWVASRSKQEVPT